jgi:protein-disulfide isomerase
MSTTTWQSTLKVPVSPTRDHIRGPVDAVVTLVEYGDYQCPHCAAAHIVLKTILPQVGDAVRYAFRHFPLSTVHPYAELAAEAAEAAGSQNSFWDMHDVLFTNQRQLDAQSLLSYAAALALDIGRFGTELAGHKHMPKVSDDFMSGVRSGVNGTPTFFINGLRHDGGWDYTSLVTALQRAAITSAAA